MVKNFLEPVYTYEYVHTQYTRKWNIKRSSHFYFSDVNMNLKEEKKKKFDALQKRFELHRPAGYKTTLNSL